MQLVIASLTNVSRQNEDSQTLLYFHNSVPYIIYS